MRRMTLNDRATEIADEFDFLDDWSLFFIITSLMVIPSLIMLYSLRHYFTDLLNKAKERDEEEAKEVTSS